MKFGKMSGNPIKYLFEGFAQKPRIYEILEFGNIG